MEAVKKTCTFERVVYADRQRAPQHTPVKLKTQVFNRNPDVCVDVFFLGWGGANFSEANVVSLTIFQGSNLVESCF